jgi:hypothetical protein
MSTFDRYDFAGSLLTGIAGVVTLLLDAPLWAVVVVYAVGGTIISARHLRDDFRER